jgi:HNH endonuclease
MPSVQTMVSRKSSITNAFVNALIPVIVPTHDEIEEALEILGMTANDVRCSYCGAEFTEWDHLRPIVLNQRPTGFISEIANLVPSCGKCNQSKRNANWREWILSETARHSPTKRKLEATADRIQKLEAYERWRQPTRIDFEAILGTDEWEAYWKLWQSVNAELRRCQDVADSLREKVAAALRQQ